MSCLIAEGGRPDGRGTPAGAHPLKTCTPDTALCAHQDMGYHIETVHSRLPSLLDQDGWTRDLRDLSITLRVAFRQDSDPSLRGACCAQTP